MSVSIASSNGYCFTSQEQDRPGWPDNCYKFLELLKDNQAPDIQDYLNFAAVYLFVPNMLKLIIICKVQKCVINDER